MIRALCWAPALVKKSRDRKSIDAYQTTHVLRSKQSRACLRALMTLGFGTMRRRFELVAIRWA